MNSPRREPPAGSVDVDARRIAVGYALVALAWIVISGLLLRFEVEDHGLLLLLLLLPLVVERAPGTGSERRRILAARC